MGDELQHSILARSIAGRAQLSSLAEVRVLDVFLATIEAIRNGPAGHAWTRRIATGPGDVDTSYHLARPLRATIATACGGSWLIDDAVEPSPNPPLEERCHACWRAAAATATATSPGGPALGEALLVVVAELALEDREIAGRRKSARGEMFPASDDPATEFAIDQHLTRLDTTSAVIALAEVERDRDEDMEVDLEWDLSDVSAGEGR